MLHSEVPRLRALARERQRKQPRGARTLLLQKLVRPRHRGIRPGSSRDREINR